MITKIQININERPETCFDCSFACRSYCWAVCPFIPNMEPRGDGEPTPKLCPLKKKNQNNIYDFNGKIFKKFA